MTDVEVSIGVRTSQFPGHVVQVNLTKRPAEVDHSQICRTCVHAGNRTWHMSRSEILSATTDGASLSSLSCTPDTEISSYRVMETTRRKLQIAPLTAKSSLRTRAVVDSCGHSIANKCKGCDRFIPIQVKVPYAKSGAAIYWTTKTVKGTEVDVPAAADGSVVSWWSVTISGHCSIPATGIAVDGKVTHCAPIERKLAIDNPSCLNCNWMDRTGENWQFDHLTVNENATLSPWERYLASLRVTDEVKPAMAYGLALKEKQSQGFGRRMWHRAKVDDVVVERGRKKYHLTFERPEVKAIIAEGDWRFEVHEVPGSNYVAVDIAWPFHKMFRRDDRMYRNVFIWPQLPKRIWVSNVDLSNPDCPRCRPNRACYFHAKGPIRSNISGDIVFLAPENASAGEWQLPGNGRMKVVSPSDGAYFAVDYNDALPQPYSTEVANAAVFRLWLPTLLATAEKMGGKPARHQILTQYRAITAQLVRKAKGVPARPSWLVNGGTEPFKPRCSHPRGLNLRKVFADSFGSERTDMDFDMGAQVTMEVEEELRVGYRQHAHTPQRLHEEIISTDVAHVNYDPSSDSIIPVEVAWPEEMSITRLEGISGAIGDDGYPITDPREFLEFLDTEVTIGQMGESERKITKRMQMFGYELSRGFYGRRSSSTKTTVGSVDSEMFIFSDDDETERSETWVCPECEASYSPGDIEDFWHPICEADGTDLVLRNARSAYDARSGGGIGNAMVMDNEFMRQNKRLSETVCGFWRLAGNTSISLVSVKGPERKRTMRAATKTTGHKVIKVGTPDLTVEQMAANAAYKAALEEVVAARTNYLIENPGISQEDLLEMFPAPDGVTYEPKAIGSAAKMG